MNHIKLINKKIARINQEFVGLRKDIREWRVADAAMRKETQREIRKRWSEEEAEREQEVERRRVAREKRHKERAQKERAAKETEEEEEEEEEEEVDEEEEKEKEKEKKKRVDSRADRKRERGERYRWPNRQPQGKVSGKGGCWSREKRGGSSGGGRKADANIETLLRHVWDAGLIYVLPKNN